MLSARRGVTLIEALIALALLAVVVSAFSGLQLANLRATRGVAVVRTAAALLAAEAALQRQLPVTAGTCHVAAWLPAGWSCQALAGCLAEGCVAESFAIELQTSAGRSFQVAGAVYRPLEAAPFQPASASEAGQLGEGAEP